jgi:ABC-type multidrug transport system ATPase subunit
VCGGLVNPEGSEFPRLPEELEELYKQSEFYMPTSDRVEIVEDVPLEHTRRHATTKKTQFAMLMERGWVSLIRDKADTRAGIAKNILVGILIGIVFFDQGNLPKDTIFFETNADGSQSTQMTGETSTLASIFFFTMMYCLMSNLQAIPALCTRDIVYRRDLNSFGYCASSYWAACMLSNLPMVLFTHTVYIISVFFLLGLEPTAAYFFFYYFMLLLTNLTSYYFALFLAASTGSAQLAFAVFPLTFLFISMFAGFTIPVDNVPPAWSWAVYISYARWVFQGLMVNEFDLYDNGDDVLEYYAFDGYNKNNSFWIVIIFLLITMCVSYLAMRPPASKLVRFEDMKNRPAPKKESDSDNLKEKLLDNTGTEDPYAAIFPSRSTYDVAWYRQNTGDIQLSRGCRLVFRNLVYTVVNKMDGKTKVQLLKGVSGRAHPGEMCALMGASGAGKSTLLDVIAGRKTTGEINGDILFNGGEVTPAIMRSSAYVMQDNVHIGVLTVRQTLTYAAHLRMDQKIDNKLKVARVNKILDMLGLAEHAGTIVGNDYIRGVSGGQLKRLSIGVEIVNLPDLIFLDEPTTGLDSSIAYEVMAAVRNLANQNRTVICTIHQPSPITYFLFDKLLLMAEGRVIYFGPARDVVNYFASSIYKFPYIRGTNPAEFVISVGGSFTAAHDGKIISGNELATYYAQSDLCRVFMENIDTMIAMDLAAVGDAPQEDIPVSQYPTDTLYQLKILLHRLVQKTIKERKPTMASFARHIIVGLFYGSIFYNLDNTQFTERLSVFFFGLMFMVLGHQQAIPALFEDRLVFYRERGAHCYGAIPYWVTLWILQIPFAMINVLIFALITYFMCGFREGHFGPYYCALLFCSWTGLFVCQATAALAPTGQAAINIFPVSLFFTVIFAGYIIFIPEFPSWLESWGPWVSFMRFGFQAMVLNELSGNEDLSEYSGYFIENLGFDDFSREECLSIIPVFFLSFATLVLVGLKYVNWEER